MLTYSHPSMEGATSYELRTTNYESTLNAPIIISIYIKFSLKLECAEVAKLVSIDIVQSKPRNRVQDSRLGVEYF